MSDKKITREQIEKMKQDKLSGKWEDKGLPLRIPSQSLVSGGANTGNNTEKDNKKD